MEAGEPGPQLVTKGFGRGDGGEPGLAGRHQPDRLGHGEEPGTLDPQPCVSQEARAPLQGPHPDDAFPDAGRASRSFEPGLGAGAQLFEAPWRHGTGEAAAETGEPGVEAAGQVLELGGRQSSQAGAGGAHGQEPQAMAAIQRRIEAEEEAAGAHRKEMDAGTGLALRHGEDLGHPIVHHPDVAGRVEGQRRVAGERDLLGLSRQDRLGFRFGGHDPTRC